MIGNVFEFAADWMPASTECPGWGTFTDDVMCLAGASTTATVPGVVIRGGNVGFGTRAGPLAIQATVSPSIVSPSIGFRCGSAPN
jgi:hypothetical protein